MGENYGKVCEDLEEVVGVHYLKPTEKTQLSAQKQLER